MFSPDAVLQPSANNSRPKRTRRAGSEDSVKLPQAKKRRSALRKDTFEPPSNAPIDDAPKVANGHLSANGHSPEELNHKNGVLQETKEITLRGARKHEKRGEKAAGVITTISPELGYVLALTHTDAFIWPYNSSSPTPAHRDLFAFHLPSSVSSPAEPLPIGTFASSSAGNEPGLVVVLPNKGKIIYWETISNASSLLPGQKSYGIEGSIPGMSSGESVVDIVNAEPAGFILTLSHGRIAHMTVKDQLGRPAIGIQFLRKVPTGNTVGFFGSIRNVLGGSGRKGRPSIAVGNASKGQRNVTIASENGEVEFWDVRANVGNSLKFQVNIKEDILSELRHHLPPDGSESYQFKLLDVSLGVPPGSTVQRLDAAASTSIVFLTSLSKQDTAYYYLIEAEISEEAFAVTATHPIRCYSVPVSSFSPCVPKLSIPTPCLTALVIFESAIVLFSLSKVAESPSSQLLREDSSLPEPFQDVVRFKDGNAFRVLGIGTEDRNGPSKHPSCVFSVQSFGIIRLSLVSSQAAEIDVQEETKISTKSRIEQAVFFGPIKNNPLDLASNSNERASRDEVEKAAFEICDEILASTSKHLQKLSSSVDQHLRLRCKAIEDLVVHVNKCYRPISRSARFRLLGCAEKLAAQRGLWKTEEEYRKRTPKGENTFFELILLWMRDKTLADPEKGNADQIRLWFTQDTSRIDTVLIWLSNMFKELSTDDIKDERLIGEYLSQAQDLLIAACESAFQFREDNASIYGLGDEQFKEGILATGYTDIPMPWTSDRTVIAQHRVLHNLLSEFLDAWWERSKIRDAQNPSREIVLRMGQRFPDFVDLLLRIVDERTRYCFETDNTGEAKTWRRLNREIRRTSMYQIAAMGFNRKATDLAEKLRDMEALNELICGQEEQVEAQLHDHHSPSEKLRLQKEKAILAKRVDDYFTTYGDEWAHARFGRMVQVGSLGTLLNKAEDPHQSSYLKHFLKQQPGYDRIRWISDILGIQEDYASASKTLQFAAMQEDDLWNKKVELCIGKLATLAAEEGQAARNSTREVSATSQATKAAVNARFDVDLATLDEQERLRNHISIILGDEINNLKDPEMKIDNVIQSIGNGPNVKGKPALAGLLALATRRVVEGQALDIDQLVDFLTLMQASGGIFEAEALDSEFATALFFVNQAADSSTISMPRFDSATWADKREALIHVIWRRTILADNWKELNKTEGMTDADVRAKLHATKTLRTMIFLAEQDLTSQSTAQPSTFSADRSSLHANSATSNQEMRLTFPSPTQIVEMESFPGVLQERFRPEEREIIAKDLDMEQEQLKILIKKARLQEHWEGLLEDAKSLVSGGDVNGEVASPRKKSLIRSTEDEEDGGVNLTGDVEMEEVN
ncbi:MAG: hypothetical protein Q9160_000927 [Pyrenula sp. 1 TL-2023]